MSVKIVYTPTGGEETTLTFARGPVDFQVWAQGRVHDNVATDGSARERVTENVDILISWQMPHMLVADDIEVWGAFVGFALPGGGFRFYPSDQLTDYYNCVLEDQGWAPKWNAPRKYGAPVKVRVLNDAHAPADPSVVLRRFHGIAD
jgi:hypothetical protein